MSKKNETQEVKCDMRGNWSKWMRWEDRDLKENKANKKNMGYPGIYACAIETKSRKLEGESFLKEGEYIPEIIYIGRTSESILRDRLKQFDNTIKGKTGHGGADRVLYGHYDKYYERDEGYEGYDEELKKGFYPCIKEEKTLNTTLYDTLKKVLYVAIIPFKYEEGDLPANICRTRGCVEKYEWDCFAQFIEQIGDNQYLPTFNNKKKAPKYSQYKNLLRDKPIPEVRRTLVMFAREKGMEQQVIDLIQKVLDYHTGDTTIVRPTCEELIGFEKIKSELNKFLNIPKRKKTLEDSTKLVEFATGDNMDQEVIGSLNAVLNYCQGDQKGPQPTFEQVMHFEKAREFKMLMRIVNFKKTNLEACTKLVQFATGDDMDQEVIKSLNAVLNYCERDKQDPQLTLNQLTHLKLQKFNELLKSTSI